MKVFRNASRGCNASAASISIGASSLHGPHRASPPRARPARSTPVDAPASLESRTWTSRRRSRRSPLVHKAVSHSQHLAQLHLHRNKPVVQHGDAISPFCNTGMPLDRAALAAPELPRSLAAGQRPPELPRSLAFGSHPPELPRSLVARRDVSQAARPQ